MYFDPGYFEIVVHG